MIIIMAHQLDLRKKRLSLRVTNRIMLLVAVLFIVLFGLRDIVTGVDNIIYLLQFNMYDSIEFGTDIIMYYIYKLFNLLHFSFQAFLFLMSSLFVGVLTVSMLKYSKLFNSNSLFIFFSFLSLFFFQSLGTNIIRQGVSLSFLLLASVNYQTNQDKKLKWLIPCVLAVLFHFTSLIPIIIFINIVFFEKLKLKLFYGFYVLCLGLSVLSISILSFKDYIGFLMVDERRAGYLTDTDEIYTIGFKPQFVAFSTFFLLCFLYIKKYTNQKAYFESLFKYYLVMSGIFFLTFQIPYSDRWGLMSWITIPILLSPIFSVNFPKRIAIVSSFVFIFIFIFFENYA